MEEASLKPTQDAKMDADPEGDLVLVVGSGENQKSIRASSKVLSLASPVLAAMFSPRRFSEGSALSSSNPPDIYLPEDNPEAVTMFCRFVHFREYHGTQQTPSFNQLLNMALFCDKYDVGSALNPWCELWLLFKPNFEKDSTYRNMLALAYAFNNQACFWRTSRNMMQYDKADATYGTKDDLLALLPHGLYSSIDEDRESALLELSSRFDSILAQFLRDGLSREGYEQSMHHPHVREAGYCFQRLFFLDIWPISTRLKTLNLDVIQRAIAEFEEPEFKEKLITEIVRAVERQKGLCLCCVRKGKMSSREGNCHARLRHLCTG